MNVTINSKVSVGGDLPAFDQMTVKTEPMLFRANREFALANGGPITKAFLEVMPWENVSIDSRVHMLMPGMWPCIPGWHHDDVPRTREDKQPNYENPAYHSEHCMALFGDCSRTEFALGQVVFSVPPIGKKIYKEWSPHVEDLCERGALSRWFAPERKLVYFDAHTWHRGSPTTHQGFRFFIRATRNTLNPIKNELRYNANVYMPVLDEGW